MQKEIIAYFRGALGDATYSKMHKTWRYSQSNREWLLKLKDLLKKVDQRSWIYKEGKTRNLYILETTAKFLSETRAAEDRMTQAEKIAFVRGFFDAEGGVPRDVKARFYVQLSQKNLEELTGIREILEGIGIQCGKMHNPSAKVDPNYWRFFVRACSYRDFIDKVGSWHPRKSKLLLSRVKI